jgi:glutamate racemase
MNKKAIGIFDSGLGGLTIVKEIKKILPQEKIIYFGDTARVPYGSKSKEVILRYSREIANFLKNKDVKLIVIACNTASAFALKELEEELDIPVIGVIKAGARSAAKQSDSIGVIGTRGTISSLAYYHEIKANNKSANIYQKSCPLFVPLIEEGMAKRYLSEIEPMIDTLVLGCTHYPLITRTLTKVTGGKIKLVNPAEESAREIKDILNKNSLYSDKRDEEDEYYSSDTPEKFKELAELFLGYNLGEIIKINIDKIESINL